MKDQEDTAAKVSSQMMKFLQDQHVDFQMVDETISVLPGVTFKVLSPQDLGTALSFLMLNREQLPVYIRPETEDSFADQDVRCAVMGHRTLKDLSLLDEKLSCASHDIHFVFKIEESKAAKLFQEEVMQYIRTNYPDISLLSHYFYEKPVGPWSGPMWGVDIAPKSANNKDYYSALKDIAEFAKARYIELEFSGTFFIHPNTIKGNDASFSNEQIEMSAQRDHFTRIWKVVGPDYTLKDPWSGPSGFISLVRYVRTERDRGTSEQEIEAFLKSKNLTSRMLSIVLNGRD
jgi:aromatic ring-cleaving dioxygenase